MFGRAYFGGRFYGPRYFGPAAAAAGVVTRLSPDEILTSTNLSGTLSAIQDDPEAPDGAWREAVDVTLGIDERLGFLTPNAPLVGAQKFLDYVRKTSGAPDPLLNGELWVDGVFRKTLFSDLPIASTTGQLVEAPWDASDLEPAELNGAGVQYRHWSVPGEIEERSLVDGLLLSDSVALAAERRLADGLLLRDTAVTATDRRLGDGLLLHDTAATETPGGEETRTFDVDPAVGGKTTWDLDVDGAFTVDGSGTWTITPSAGFSGAVTLWGGGGGSGGHGQSAGGSATAGDAGGATTFSGLTANGGGGSDGATDNVATAGAAGGTASGGDTNTSGSAGTTGTIGGTSVGGDGGASPNGGATASGTASSDTTSTSGTAGNAPGGGAGGGARGGPSLGRRSIGGGGGGGYTTKTYAAGALIADDPITLTVGGGGAAGTGSQADGSAGAAGRVTIV